MKHVKRFLWKNLGITLNKRFMILAGIVLISCIAAVSPAFFPAIAQNRYALIAVTLITTAGFTIVLGSTYTALDWALSSKEERRQIETEVSLKQLKTHVAHSEDTSDTAPDGDI